MAKKHPKRQRTLITGGAGFVGRAVADAFCARGDEVIVVEPGGAAWRDDIAYQHGDVRDAERMRALCQGVDTVVHNASLVHTRHNREEDVWSVNLGGTRTVLRACWENRVPKLIYISSASTVYEGKDVENGDESLPYSRISQAPYADAKIAAEQEVLAANGQRGVATCALRPHVIFGPGDTRFLPAVLDRARAGKLRFRVGLFNRKLSDFTYIDNLIDAVVRADERLRLDSPVAGQAYFITNGEPMRFFDFVGRVLEQLGLPPIVGAVPFPVAYLVAAAAEGLDTLRGGTLNSEDGLSRFAVRYMCTHHYFSIDRARRELGYDPKVSVQEGIDRTVRALLAREANAA